MLGREPTLFVVHERHRIIRKIILTFFDQFHTVFISCEVEPNPE